MSTAPQQPQTAAPSTHIDQAKIEYDRLISYFKLLVWVTGVPLGLLIAVGSFYLGKSVEDVKSQAATTISATQSNATQQISAIGIAAQDTAQKEAKKAIEAALAKPNIQHLVQDTAQQQVAGAVDEAVRKNLGAKIDAFRTFVIEIGEINNHGAQLRLDYRSGLDYLLKARENPDPSVRAYASSTLRSVAADYEYAVATNPTPPFQVLVFTTTAPAQFSTKELMRMINTAKDPSGPMKIAVLFAAMKGKVNWDVPMLDLPAAKKWCAQHKPKCDE